LSAAEEEGDDGVGDLLRVGDGDGGAARAAATNNRRRWAAFREAVAARKSGIKLVDAE